MVGWIAIVVCSTTNAQDRALGLDVSAWQGSISSSSWSTLHSVNNRDFVFIRSSRGGATGFYNQNDSDNSEGQNTLSQRYDDPYFVQNITRATNAGLLAGAYHFARPDIVASTPNSGGVANTGADEADHFIEMAGAWMRPGYLLPVLDLESGQSVRSRDELAQFAIDFSDRIYEVMGVRPSVYIGGNYANYVQGASDALQDQLVASLPNLWSARWPNQDNPNAIPVQTGHPKDSYTPIYGPWDDSPNPTHPWAFWQYASTGRLSGYNNGNSNLDLNVAQGGIEFLKDRLVPALWTGGASGEWTDLDNWNSGQEPIAPVRAPGQDRRVGSLTLPETRLPGIDDTVVLDRPDESVVVTLSSGAHTIRRLVVREALNLTGGSLTVGHTPSSDSPDASVVVSAPVSIVNGGLSAHTVAVDAGQVLTLAGELTLRSLQLESARRSPAEVAITGDVVWNPLGGAEAAIGSVGTSAAEGSINLGGQNFQWTVADGAAATDLRVSAAMTNGSFVKNGDGSLVLEQATGYQGDVDVRGGELRLEELQIDDQANVALTGGSLLTLDRDGAADVIGRLTIDGTPMGVGQYGAIGSGAQFELDLLAGAGLLQVTAVALAGDYNADGVVDASDYTLWRDNVGSAIAFPNESATPGAVDQADYDAWRANFGATAGTSAAKTAAAPEPASVLLLLIGVAGAAARRQAPLAALSQS